MIRNQFTFYRSYYDSLVELPDEEQAQTLLAIIRYAIYGSLPEKLSVSGKIAFNLVKPTLDSSRKKAAAGRAGGCSDGIASTSVKSKKKSASTSGKSKIRECLSDSSKLDIDIERELDIDIGIGETPASGTSREDAFEQILSAYPAHRLGNREACIDAWNTVETGQEEAVLKGLSKWKDSAQWTSDGGRFIPSLSRFLTEKMWQFPPPQAGEQSWKCSSDSMEDDLAETIRKMFAEDKENLNLTEEQA